MSQVGDYQSLIQLAAGLSVGILAFETLLDSPIARMRPRYERLMLEIKSVFKSTLPPDFETHRKLFQDLEGEVSTALTNDESEWELPLLRVLGILVCCFSIWLLIDNADRYSAALNAFDRPVAIAVAVIPLALTVGLIWLSHRRLKSLEGRYEGLEGRYLQAVDKAWGLK